MRNITYNIHDDIKYFIINGYDIKQISYIMKKNEKNVADILIEFRRDIINKCEDGDLYLINIIDALIGKLKVDERYKEVLELLSLNDICSIYSFLKINVYNFASLIKNIYVYIFCYGTKEEKKHLPLLRKSIDKINEILLIKLSNKQKKIYSNFESVSFDKKKGKKVVSKAPIKNIFSIGNMCNLRVLVISDTHFGHYNENLDYLFEVYNYASKHGIRYIIHAGDLIEGNVDGFSCCKEEYVSSQSQLEHVIYDYLFDKNIVNLILLGNHDASVLIKDGIDLYEELEIRDDFITLGYRYSLINCNGEYISIKHDIEKVLHPVKDDEVFLNLSGHSHIYNAYHNDKTAFIRVPTLSDVSPSSSPINKGFMDINMHFDNGIISEVTTNFIPVDECSKEFYSMILIK